jgi:hypothetical protein
MGKAAERETACCVSITRDEIGRTINGEHLESRPVSQLSIAVS